MCGVILVAAPGRKMGDILRSQLAANPANGPVLPDALSAIERLERGEPVDVSTFHPALQGLFAPAVQAFLIDLMANDPAVLAAKVSLPMLIVQGDNDLQIPRENGDALRAAQPAAAYVVIPAMNHVLKNVEAGNLGANMAAYANPALPVAPELVDAIVGFISSPSGGSQP